MTKKQIGKGGDFDTRPNPFAGRRNHTAPSWAECSRLGLAMDKCVGAGCAVILGATRDGGALVVTILDGDNRHKTYCSTTEELEAAIQAIEDMFEDC